MNKEIEQRTPDDYDKLVERVLHLETFIESCGLEVPDTSYWSRPELLNIIEEHYSNLNIMMMESRSYPMSYKVLEVLRIFIKNVEESGISSDRLRWHQKPSIWPKFIRKYIRDRSAKKYQKKYYEDYHDGN